MNTLELTSYALFVRASLSNMHLGLSLVMQVLKEWQIYLDLKS
uniref:Uncharacterized protein n=1 Tax=Anguilla anguilla TaxID=7936 RepID=A0A0E9S1E7_ANGAN